MREEFNKKLVFLFTFVSVLFQILKGIVHPCLKFLAFRTSYSIRIRKCYPILFYHLKKLLYQLYNTILQYTQHRNFYFLILLNKIIYPLNYKTNHTPTQPTITTSTNKAHYNHCPPHYKNLIQPTTHTTTKLPTTHTTTTNPPRHQTNLAMAPRKKTQPRPQTNPASTKQTKHNTGQQPSP